MADSHAQPASPIEVHDPVVRDAVKQASVWLGLAALLFLVWTLANAILLIFGGLVFAAFLDGGSRLLARVWPGSRGLRLTIIVALLVAGLAGFLALAGLQIAAQWDALSTTLARQFARLAELLAHHGVVASTNGAGVAAGLASELFGSVGKLTQFVGGALGALGSLILIMILGLFIAGEPRLYERGVEWLTPKAHRAGAEELMRKLAATLRRWTAGRLVAMAIDGLLTTAGLLLAGIPLAGLLGLIAGALAFIPNIGALIAGTLIILIGLSVDTAHGIAALGVYLVVQFVEGNLLTPFVERRAVDLAPAVTLAAQLLFGATFGILGIALADPIVAMAKVGLEHRRSARRTPASEPPSGHADQARASTR